MIETLKGFEYKRGLIAGALLFASTWLLLKVIMLFSGISYALSSDVVRMSISVDVGVFFSTWLFLGILCIWYGLTSFYFARASRPEHPSGLASGALLGFIYSLFLMTPDWLEALTDLKSYLAVIIIVSITAFLGYFMGRR